MSTPPVATVLLAAGYGTRLYPLTENKPKALLDIAGRAILDWIYDDVRKIPNRSNSVLVTNHKFAGQFAAWGKRHHDVVTIDDGTETNDTRLGAIRDLQLALKQVDPAHDVLVLGTDNLFTWPLADFVQAARAKRPAATVAIREVATLQEASKLGIVKTDPAGRILQLVEKPKEPPSRLAALCIYFFPSATRPRVDEFLSSGANGDAPGFYISWLVQQEPVYGFTTAGEWLDIGSHESYQQAIETWTRRTAQSTTTRRT